MNRCIDCFICGWKKRHNSSGEDGWNGSIQGAVVLPHEIRRPFHHGDCRSPWTSATAWILWSRFDWPWVSVNGRFDSAARPEGIHYLHRSRSSRSRHQTSTWRGWSSHHSSSLQFGKRISQYFIMGHQLEGAFPFYPIKLMSTWYFRTALERPSFLRSPRRRSSIISTVFFFLILPHAKLTLDQPTTSDWNNILMAKIQGWHAADAL